MGRALRATAPEAIPHPPTGVARFTFEARDQGFAVVPEPPSIPPMAWAVAVLLPALAWTLLNVPDWMGSSSPLPPWAEVSIAATLGVLVPAIAWIPSKLEWNRGPWLEVDTDAGEVQFPRLGISMPLGHVQSTELESEEIQFQGGSSGPHRRRAYRLGLRISGDSTREPSTIHFVSSFERSSILELQRSIRTALWPAAPAPSSDPPPDRVG